jgi:hypothetical protein
VRELLDAGHEVIGLARTEAAEKKLLTAAAKPHRGNVRVRVISLQTAARAIVGSLSK